MANLKTSLVLGLALVATAGCTKKRIDDVPPPPVNEYTPAPDTGSGEEPTTPLNEQFKREVASNTINFGFDQYDIDAQARVILDSQARWLVARPGVRVTIEGHTDERGTREYNIGLGERRANATKNYLAARGISPSQITTISYGKERPVALSSDEQSWRENRRAVTIVIN